eukprot:CAMPEP_0172480954 /NCGR_PEP_ID=MMETSP1066-20121228/6485_1 /TAXON_ID=671091 /ORGANISM="Coscinodiscus wailesii, Strain CCMP2513" /LENGTH=100 /DNA_ID=CAMNT_0013242797 /DNA_START=551 /DNA_END=853 /DNA_ORIENTATION=+
MVVTVPKERRRRRFFVIRGRSVRTKEEVVDKEYELSLESMDAKREMIVGNDACLLTALAAENEEMVHKIKVLEGVLVQVFVEQQKMILEILLECGAAGRR